MFLLAGSADVIPLTTYPIRHQASIVMDDINKEAEVFLRSLRPKPQLTIEKVIQMKRDLKKQTKKTVISLGS
jgi:hypothetical protein